MQRPVSLTSIPHYIVAASPKELRRLMFKNNLKHGLVFKYFDIQQTQDGNWICWYFHDLEFNSLIKDDIVKDEQKIKKGGS